ncbi:carbonic anhydrase [Crepidotus variabilis]|uniref:Carbonic anhydrase n=1 Tax=Crepidotus variabilis TaxID=179855 RepID=A0A9P6JN49_9AGAR|nr:carbonic anhydrase [Crepidotus variabilis]
MPVHQLLATNAQWAADVAQSDPTFFPTSAQGQSPHTLWIGCADSRVPASVITGAKPGELFVHRNIANQFHPDDKNILSVLRYAVDHLGVEHVVIVGHSRCGGAQACLNAALAPNFVPGNLPIATIEDYPAEEDINRWLEPLTELTASLELGSISDAALQTIVEENVKLQVKNLSQSEVIQRAFENGTTALGKKVQIHGWVYDLATGRLKDLHVSQSSK